MKESDILSLMSLFALSHPTGVTGGPASIAPGRPNILFVIADQWRAQAFGFAGEPATRLLHTTQTRRRPRFSFMKCLKTLAALVIWTVRCAVAASGAPDPDNWKDAQWIGYTEDQRPSELAERTSLYAPNSARQPKAVQEDSGPVPVQRRAFLSPMMRRPFRLEKPVRSARASVCGLGLYELYLNGRKVRDRVLDPAQTTYDRRAFYVIHDVTGLLRQGGNVIGLMLGNGFYGQNFAFGGGLAYGEPRAAIRLVIEFQDGSKETIVTDGSWKAAQGPVLFDNIYSGETYDARREREGWCGAGYDDSAWKPVRKMDAPTVNLIEQHLEPMRRVRSVTPVAVIAAENGQWILDLGQNMTGWLQIRVREESGRTIRMRFAELLMPDGKAMKVHRLLIHLILVLLLLQP